MANVAVLPGCSKWEPVSLNPPATGLTLKAPSGQTGLSQPAGASWSQVPCGTSPSEAWESSGAPGFFIIGKEQVTFDDKL